MPGTIIGRYVIRERLAEGGMAEIFLASALGEEGFSKDVVIKVIRPALGADPQFVSMFIAEARLASRLNHANIVHIFDFGKHEDRHYLAMEYVRGASLAALRTRCREVGRPFPPTLAAEIAAQVARGLHYAHGLSERGVRLGVVHRDVSPHNVLLSFDGAVKLTDFGIAKAASSHTTAGMLKGKFAYMAPEQSRGDPVDARTDVFALGIVLWELLTAGRLFDADSDVGVLRAVQESFIAPPARLNSDVPVELSDLVMKALARPREERFQTAEEFDRALSAFVLRAARSPDDFSVARFLREVFPEEAEREEHDGLTGENEGPPDGQHGSASTHHGDRSARSARSGLPQGTITHTPSSARTSRATPARRGASGARAQPSHGEERGPGGHEGTTIPVERLDDPSVRSDDEGLGGRSGGLRDSQRRPSTARMPQFEAVSSERTVHTPSRRSVRFPRAEPSGVREQPVEAGMSGVSEEAAWADESAAVSVSQGASRRVLPSPRPSKALSRGGPEAVPDVTRLTRTPRLAIVVGGAVALGLAGLAGLLLWPNERAAPRPADEAPAAPTPLTAPGLMRPKLARATGASNPAQPTPKRGELDTNSAPPVPGHEAVASAPVPPPDAVDVVAPGGGREEPEAPRDANEDESARRMPTSATVDVERDERLPGDVVRPGAGATTAREPGRAQTVAPPATTSAKQPAVPMGRLVVTASPFGAVYANGRKLGDAYGSGTFSLPPGRYQVKVVHPRKSVQEDVTIRAGEAARVEFDLLR